MSPSQKIEVVGTIEDDSGNHRLVLRFVQVDVAMKGEGIAYDFYSLDWEIKDDAKWVQKLSISEDDFEKGCKGRRWVSDLESFDPVSGLAILRVGEEGVPDEVGAAHVTYSRREWDVLNNRESRLIRVCKDPFEPFKESKDEN